MFNNIPFNHLLFHLFILLFHLILIIDEVIPNSSALNDVSGPLVSLGEPQGPGGAKALLSVQVSVRTSALPHCCQQLVERGTSLSSFLQNTGCGCGLSGCCASSWALSGPALILSGCVRLPKFCNIAFPQKQGQYI